MTDYTKLVKELRGCKYIDYCKDCPRMAANGYVEICNIKDDAAAAIEALQAKNTDIREELFVSQRKYDNFVAVASMENAMLAKQLPKRGEWLPGREISRSYVGDCCVSIDFEDWRCSICGNIIETPCNPKYKYCPNCGAKMEVEE